MFSSFKNVESCLVYSGLSTISRAFDLTVKYNKQQCAFVVAYRRYAETSFALEFFQIV